MTLPSPYEAVRANARELSYESRALSGESGKCQSPGEKLSTPTTSRLSTPLPYHLSDWREVQPHPRGFLHHSPLRHPNIREVHDTLEAFYTAPLSHIRASKKHAHNLHAFCTAPQPSFHFRSPSMTSPKVLSTSQQGARESSRRVHT